MTPRARERGKSNLYFVAAITVTAFVVPVGCKAVVAAAAAVSALEREANCEGLQSMNHQAMVAALDCSVKQPGLAPIATRPVPQKLFESLQLRYSVVANDEQLELILIAVEKPTKVGREHH